MNFGTPQEMIDEERDTYGEDYTDTGCLPIILILVIVIIALIIKKYV